MSWQSFIDEYLIGSGFCSAGAILGLHGAVLAASPDFEVSLCFKNSISCKSFYQLLTNNLVRQQLRSG
jgi:hypothetical protein